MERMTKGEGMTPEEYIAMVEEENKNLNTIIENTKIEQEADRKHIEELEEENKKLKSDLAYERTMLDNVRAEYKSLQNVIKKLKDIQEEVKPTQKSKTITVTDEDNRIILEKGEDGKWHRYGGGNVVLC